MLHMFDLTDEDEMNPYTKRKVIPPSEVKPIPLKPNISDESALYQTWLVKQNKDKEKKETPKNDAHNEYDYSDDKDIDDKEW